MAVENGSTGLEPPRPRSKPTIYDVARLAEVSHQTVARYLNGAPGLKTTTRTRVENALTQLDYRPNYTARALAHGKSHRIVALTHEIEQFGPSRTLIGASRAAREAGYLLEFVSFDADDDADVALAIETTNTQDTAGIIVFASTERVLERFTNAGFQAPLVVSGEADEAAGDHGATINWSGIRLLLDHLQSLGHSSFAEIAGPEDWISARNRSFALESELQSRGLQLAAKAHGDWSAASGYAATNSFDFDSGFTAVVAANDQMAIGGIRALAEMGRRIPEDISVVGFDDIPDAEFLRPPLTTVNLDFGGFGRQAVARILEQIDPAAGAATSTDRLPHLVVRASSGPTMLR